MFKAKPIMLSLHLAMLLLSYSSLGHAETTDKTFFNFGFLYIQPNSDNLKYATFVSGTQPYYQSWHYQAVKPNYHPSFELGFNYAFPQTSFGASVNWVHLNSFDSDSKQASTNTDLSTVEFVGPPYEMSPPVFGIKHVDSKVHFNFDNVLLNMSKLFAFGSHVQARLFGGISVLNVNQNITTTFSDYAGSPPTAYSYPLPPDPSFSFKTENISKYLGAGPDLGVSIRYLSDSGFGVLGEFLGSLAVGTISTKDKFTSTSARLTSNGIGVSHQEITAPHATQTVFGGDGKIGLFYHYQGTNMPAVNIELGYRMASYLNAISTIRPSTLVQPGTVIVTPEFSTGTMAIVSTLATSHPFNFSGPFLDIKIEMC